MKSQDPHRARAKSAAREIAYIAVSVAILAVCAWVTVPFGPVPFTLQTFAVCFIGALLGWKRSLATVAVYILMGLVGIPMFSGFKAGTAALLGPTGGYIFGFFFAALVPALFKLIPIKNKWARFGIFYAANILGLALCYLFGTVWFVLMNSASVGSAIALCVTPFLIPDAIKLFVAALLSSRLERYIK